jgi:SAM-dependent methyltransferase
MISASEIQLQYYTDTAKTYEDQHGNALEHETALKVMAAIMLEMGMTTVLDVGSGTGRALSYLLHRGFDARGVGPVPALIEEAVKRRGVPAERLQSGRGESLPFPDRSFDVAYETGVLHHVADPNQVVKEMIGVARRAVFLSDENRFGVGNWPSRLLAFSLYKLRLARLYTFLRTNGKMYIIDRDDGLRYSYSVYESLPVVAPWADSVFLIATKPVKSASWFQPLFTSSHILLSAIKT